MNTTQKTPAEKGEKRRRRQKDKVPDKEESVVVEESVVPHLPSEVVEPRPKKILYGGNQLDDLSQAIENEPEHEAEYLAGFTESLLDKGPDHPSVNKPKPVVTFPLDSGDLHVDLNPPLYPSQEQRKNWNKQQYLDYMATAHKAQIESLDFRVAASRSLFYSDFFGLDL